MNVLRLTKLIIVVVLFINPTLFSQTSNKFSKKITSYLSKDEVIKAEEFCEQQKTEQEKAVCYTFMGDNALNEMEYAKAMEYYLKAKNKDKEYNALLEAEKSGNIQLIDNLLIRLEKEKIPDLDLSTLNQNAFMPIAQICFSKKDYKNAGNYYEKAGVKQLSIECKVLYAINSKDYISVVELSEQEAIGLKNTIDVYKHAADQYFEKSDFKNASKCYSKVGDKLKTRLCFEKEKELELKKTLTIVYANKFEFSENPLTIVKKLNAIKSQISNFKQTASSYEQNGYSIESDNWSTFAKLINVAVEESVNGCYIIKPAKAKTRDGKPLLTEAWKIINEICYNKQLSLSEQKQQPLKNIVEEIRFLNKDYTVNVQDLANKQLDISGITIADAIYQFPKAVESAKKLMDDYFISINTKTTPKNMSWLVLSVVEKMYTKIIKKLDDLYSSAKSESIKKKIIEQKDSFQEYYNNKSKETFYLEGSFKPNSWSEYLLQKKLKANIVKNIVVEKIN